MNIFRIVTLAVLGGTCSLPALADRDTGWEFGGDVIYQNSQDFDFEGGSSASLDTDWGFALNLGYRFNERLELTFGLDWSTVDYDATIQSGDFPNLQVGVDGDLEVLTPRVGVNFNFFEGDVTPFVSGFIGYSFIDTNIPDGPPQGGCWWDPWYGEVCTAWQPTRSTEEFTYGLGLGVRWDVNDTWSMRFGYEKHWLDISTIEGSADLDQIKVGLTVRY